MMKRLGLFASLSLAVLAAAGSASALTNLIENGSFESPTTALPRRPVAPGGSFITDWNVSPRTIEYVGSFWKAADGSYSIGLQRQASIFQSFATKTNQIYTVTFDMSGNPDSTPDLKGLSAVVGGTVHLFSVNTTGYTLDDLTWTPERFTFVATNSTSTLSFAGRGAGVIFSGDAAIDNVSVVEGDVPEPSSWLLMIGGLGLVGFALRRRQPGRRQHRSYAPALTSDR
jgi:choice-of-anchor C domain-containing protein